jgi:transient-receptor-potential calcium channel protein
MTDGMKGFDAETGVGRVGDNNYNDVQASPRTAFFTGRPTAAPAPQSTRISHLRPFESIDTEEGEEGDLKPLTSTRMRIRRKSKLSSDFLTGDSSPSLPASALKHTTTMFSSEVTGGFIPNHTSKRPPLISQQTLNGGQPGQPWKQLTNLEKKYLIAVERGDLGSVRRFLETPFAEDFSVNCCDPIGRSALLMAIDNENLEMIELLISYGVEMKDALLHAINEEFVEAVELLLDHEESVHLPGQPYSWEAMERETFTTDVTPLILAAHKNNYEIIKLILDRGISPIPSPHDARCGCKSCRQSRVEDHLRHSRSRINAYRALASPCLIALSSKDPILTAFELSWQLRRLSFLEPEFKTEYLELRKQCQLFATALLDHTRTTHELEVLLNHDPGADSLDSHGKMTLSRLKLAIRCKQKKFCAHANVQQLLASIWYEGLPGFRRKNIVVQTLQIIFIGFLFPFFSIAYILAPCTRIGQVMKKPFIKFICHSASYMTFLGEFIVYTFVFFFIHSSTKNFRVWLGRNFSSALERSLIPFLMTSQGLVYILRF